MEETKQFNPEMLVVARKARGLTQSALATRLTMKQAHLSKIEAGVLNPPENMVERLGVILRFKKDFFFYSSSVRAFLSSLNCSTVI